MAMSWSEDGRSLYVIEPGDVPAAVHLLNLSTGERRRWKELRPVDATGVERINRVRVAPQSDAYAYTYYMLLCDLYMLEGAAA